MRLLLGNLQWMKRSHIAFIGSADPTFAVSVEVARHEMREHPAPLEIIMVSGDHFTSFDEAVTKFLVRIR